MIKKIIRKIINLKRRIIKTFFKYKVLLILKTDLSSCYLCDSNDFEMLYNKDRFGLPIKTQRCRVCGAVQVNPKPNERFINKFYATSMYRGMYKGMMFASKRFIKEDNSLERAKIHISFLYKNNLLKGSLLDFGCSEGTFLKELPKDMELFGVEPGTTFNNFYREINIYNNISEINRKFDIITSWHSLEHLYNPLETLKAFKERLNENGVIIIEVPDFDKYEGIRNIHIGHLFHFNYKIMEKICDKIDLRIKFISREFLMDSKFGIKFVLELKNNL